MSKEELCAWLRQQHGEYTNGLAVNDTRDLPALQHDMTVLNCYVSYLLTVAMCPPKEVAHVPGA